MIYHSMFSMSWVCYIHFFQMRFDLKITTNNKFVLNGNLFLEANDRSPFIDIDTYRFEWIPGRLSKSW